MTHLNHPAVSSDTAPAVARKWLQLIPFLLFFLLLFSFTCRVPFFWDKDILYSKIAHWLPGHRYSLILPVEMDPGYPPALAYLLAFAWQITGKSLFTAHLLMLPFTLGLVWQTRDLIDRLFGDRYIVPAMILVFADTVILSQTVVFSTDLVMLFFMVLGINAILGEKRILLAWAVAGLLFSHMRGLMVVAALGIFNLYSARDRESHFGLFRTALPYIPALGLFIAWMAYHFYRTGWLLYHPASPWSGCFEQVNGKGFARNVIILVWRMVDFGRVFVWIIPVLAFFRLNRKNLLTDPTIKLLLLLLTATLIFSLPSMLIYRILNGHRYLITFFYLLSLLAAYLLFINPGFRSKRILFILALAGLVSGNFWIYPGKIANSWDANLAHLPYHHLRKEMIRYLEEKNIPFDQVGSEVPNIVPIRYIEVNDDDRSFHRADLKTDRYVFYSNVFNMFTDEEIDELNNSWVVAKEYRCMLVYVKLYRKK
jgi:hypothetical protein